MTLLLRPVTKMKCSMPAARASSTTCWISGRSTTVSISFGMALVAGRNRVPRPATGKTALRMGVMRLLRAGGIVAGGGVKVRVLITEKPYLVPYGGRKKTVSGLGRILMRITNTIMRALVPLVVLSAVACAQDERYPQALPLTTGSISGASSSSGWTGQPGASGHPDMMPDAIVAAAANFPNCVAAMWPDAAKRGISRDAFDQFTAGLEPDVKIMDLVDAQPEFTKAFWEYVDTLVTDERIAKGRELLAQNAVTFEAVERAYGVDRYIIAA